MGAGGVRQLDEAGHGTAWLGKARQGLARRGMARQGKGRSRSFHDVVAEAIRDITENGFDSQERIDRWLRELRIAAERETMSAASVESMMRDALTAIYTRLVERGSILRFAPGMPRYTLERVKPKLRGELDRRIAASANLIKLNREEAINKTLRRFQGWSTSIPPGGIPAEDKRTVKAEIRKSLASLPFEERRVLVDQGHKLTAALADITANENGAIAARWRSNWRQPGYDYREDHKDRDGQVYLIRGSWAQRDGLVKPSSAGWVDDVTAPGQEVYCRCYYTYAFNLRDLPDDMLTAKGRAALAKARENIYATVTSGRTDNADAGSINGKTERGVAEGMADSQDNEVGESSVIAGLDRLGFLQGLGSIRFITDEDRWHAGYDDREDQITLESKFFDMPSQERLHVFLHEAGHRGQFTSPAIYNDFLREHLGRLEDFMDMANKEHLRDFQEHGIERNVMADEVFAESYARACLGLPMPETLRWFWTIKFNEIGLRSKQAVFYGPVWRNKITRCQRCEMFLRVSANVAENACTAVEGRISSHGHCKLFKIQRLDH